MTVGELREKGWYWLEQGAGRLLRFVKRGGEKFYFETSNKEPKIYHESGLKSMRPAIETEIQEHGPAGSKEDDRKRAAKQRGALFETNEAFKGNRYDPSINTLAAMELKSLALDLCISCQSSKRDELAKELGLPVEYIFRGGESSNGGKFEIVFVNTKRVKELCDCLEIYANPYAFFGKSFENVAVCSRAMGEELMDAGMMPHSFRERDEDV